MNKMIYLSNFNVALHFSDVASKYSIHRIPGENHRKFCSHTWKSGGTLTTNFNTAKCEEGDAFIETEVRKASTKKPLRIPN